MIQSEKNLSNNTRGSPVSAVFGSQGQHSELPNNLFGRSAQSTKIFGIFEKNNSYWMSVVCALWSAVWYYCIRINWKNIGKTSWENMRIINKKPEDPGFVCFIDVCNKSTMYSMLGCG